MVRFLLVVGRRGAGKGEFVEVAKAMGIPVYEMSYGLRREMEEKGLKVDKESLPRYALKVREEHGYDYVARLAWKYLPAREGLVVISGVRSKEEVDFFATKGLVLVLEIRAKDRLRFQRVLQRGRDDDPKTYDEFLERERREDALGLNEVIWIADIHMSNEGPLEEFRGRAKRFLRFVK